MEKLIRKIEEWLKKYDKTLRFIAQYGLIATGGVLLFTGGFDPEVAAGIVALISALKARPERSPDKE